jgi:alpha-tubulin suppressor-like RCC1 family protein
MRLALCGLVVASVGCSHAAYECTGSDQCVSNGMPGTCEPQGFCSFPDTTCPSGQRFEPNAGGALGGQCVADQPGGDSGVCGAVGMACCANSTCSGNAFCQAGTCQQCVTDVAVGQTHSCFLKYDHTVWCSGRNDDGQLGNGGMATIPTATPQQVLDGNGPITDAIAVGAAVNYSCAVRTGGTVWCWGENANCNDGGQLGDGTTNDATLAVQVIRASDSQPLTGIAQVSGAYCHTCARDTTGGAWCWGTNSEGRLGDGTVVSHLSAAPVLSTMGGTAFTGVADLSVGEGHVCVLTTAGAVWCWGDNGHGQVGNNSTTEADVPVKILNQALAVRAGRFHTCAVKPDGTVWCWGQGNQGRLGNGTGDKSDSGLDKVAPVPVLTAIGGVPFGGAASVADGAVSCAVMANKDAYCWGVNLYGQTGTGPGTYVPMPVLRTNGQPLHDVERLVAQFTRACAFLSDGNLVCWGRNSEGQLGDGTFSNYGAATPVKLSCP